MSARTHFGLKTLEGSRLQASYSLKPLSLKHLDVSDEQIRDFWLKYTTSCYSDLIVNQFNNIRKVIKKGSVNYPGKR